MKAIWTAKVAKSPQKKLRSKAGSQMAREKCDLYKVINSGLMQLKKTY